MISNSYELGFKETLVSPSQPITQADRLSVQPKWNMMGFIQHVWRRRAAQFKPRYVSTEHYNGDSVAEFTVGLSASAPSPLPPCFRCSFQC